MDKTEKSKPALAFRTYHQQLTQQEIADLFGVKRQYVHKIEQLALRKLRRALEKQSTAFEDFQ